MRPFIMCEQGGGKRIGQAEVGGRLPNIVLAWISPCTDGLPKAHSYFRRENFCNPWNLTVVRRYGMKGYNEDPNK